MREILSVYQIADYLKLSRHKIYQMIKARTIPACRIDRQYLFLKNIVDEWVAELAKQGGEKE